jgi:hypothetical protein
MNSDAILANMNAAIGSLTTSTAIHKAQHEYIEGVHAQMRKELQDSEDRSKTLTARAQATADR